MKKIYTLFLLSLFFIPPVLSQVRQDGKHLKADKRIINVPENQHMFLKKGNIPLNDKSTFFSEGFDTPSTDGALPAGWTQKRTANLNDNPVIDATTPRWFRLSSDYFFEGDDWETYVYSGSGSLTTGYSSGSPDATGDGIFTWAITPQFTIANEEGDVNLTYWNWFYNGEFEGIMYYTRYHVKIFADNAWTNLFSVTGNSENTNLFETPVTHILNEYKGKTVQLAFVYEFSDGWQLAIDEIFVGSMLENDFEISDAYIFPRHGIEQGTPIEIAAEVSATGTQSGTPALSLLINNQVVETQNTPVLNNGEEPQWVFFDYTPQQAGIYSVTLQLADDEFNDNNSITDEFTVYDYLKLAEDFENYVADDQGEFTFVWPPQGWTVNNDELVFADQDWVIFETASAVFAGRTGDPEQILTSPPVEIAERDESVSFYLEGVNNNINVTDAGSVPMGEQGFSTFQLKYSTTATGPWTNLGDPVRFENVYDQNNNLVQDANELRKVEIDITNLSPGTYYFAFTTNSNFALTINNEPYYSFVLLDNILIGENSVVNVGNPLQTDFNIKLYPNPAVDHIVIDAQYEIHRVEVFTLEGKKISSKSVNSTSFLLPVTDMENGIYIISTYSAEGVYNTRFKVIR